MRESLLLWSVVDRIRDNLQIQLKTIFDFTPSEEDCHKIVLQVFSSSFCRTDSCVLLSPNIEPAETNKDTV